MGYTVKYKRGIKSEYPKDIERSLASELRVWRNKWARQELFSNNDTDRALDSAERLPRAFSAKQQADEIGHVVGRNGVNIRLASRLSGRQINVRAL